MSERWHMKMPVAVLDRMLQERKEMQFDKWDDQLFKTQL